MRANTSPSAQSVVDLPAEDRILAGWRYDGEACAVDLMDGSTVSGRVYAVPGWSEPSAGSDPGILVVDAHEEHWIAVRQVRWISPAPTTPYDNTVLTVGSRVRLVAEFAWYDGAYSGAMVEITEIEHGFYREPYNASYLVTPVARNAAHMNIAVAPQDLDMPWFDEPPPIACPCADCASGWSHDREPDVA